MHSFEETRQMPFSAELIKEIVLDIEKYPEFLPWCRNVKIISQNDNEIVAEMVIEFKGFSESYCSKIIYKEEKDQYFVNVQAISGPFKQLNNLWKIKKMGQDCSEVNFYIDFELKSRILNMVIGVVFSSATEKMVSAFEQRAQSKSVL